MKRYVCTVAVGFVLALTGTATASASGGLPLPGQSGDQKTEFGNQTVGEQKNDADVTQEQGNGNLNIAPAIGLFGDAETKTEQGNGNYAKSDVDQENDVDQTQESTQKQSLEQSGSNGSCCDGQSQAGEQKTYGGDQSVDKQENDADVTQEQGNDNVNVSPAIAIFGDAETKTEQGNGNVAKSDVDQENDVDQSQSSTQKQDATQERGDGGCCAPKKGYGEHENGCCDGQSQTGEQKTSFGDQTVGKQKNDADVTQKQGNGNVNVSPAIAIFGDAETTTKQGNGNYAESDVDQKNDVDQSQESYQRQSLDQSGGSNGKCCGGQSQTGEQKVYGGDQSVEEQKNDADVTQKQGNGNVNFSPAIAVFGDAETRTYQGNGNVAKSDVDQKNDVDQSQSSTQKQELSQSGGSCCQPKKDYGKHGYAENGCCESGSSQTGEQKTSFGDQTVGKQENDADVTQKQGNDNESFAPAIGLGGRHENTCNSKCGYSGHGDDGASTTTAQGNGNYAKSDIDQKNDVDQSQSAKQKQHLTQEGGNCCEKPRKQPDCSYGCHPKQPNGGKPPYDCTSKCEPQKHPEREQCCEQEQSGEQKTYFGDQTVGEQKNDADVTQKQGNDNESFAPAIGFGSKKHGSCYSKCGESRYPDNDGAKTETYQGNGNVAKSYVDQRNDVDQSQTSYQHQTLVQKCTGLFIR